MTPRRLLLVTGEYPPMQGGVADYTAELGRALVEQGMQVAVLTADQAGDSRWEGGMEVRPGVKDWGFGCWDDLDAVVAMWRPDVVHIQYQTAAYAMKPGVNLWPWRPWRRRQVVTAVTFHDLRLPYLFPKAHALRRWVTATLARSCNLAITTNPEDSTGLRAVRSDLIEIPIGSNIACQPPVDFERRTWRQRWGIPATSPVLCYFGFLNASKGGELLVEVLRMLVEQDFDAHLLMIGGSVGASDPTNRGYLQVVESAVNQADVAARVHWTGHLPAPDVSAAFLASDVCLLPYQDGVSYRRGSFMAAVAHGMPIVTTRPVVPYPELVDGDTLMLADIGDAVGLAAACRRVLSDRFLRELLHRNAELLAGRFSWGSIAQLHAEAYGRLFETV